MIIFDPSQEAILCIPKASQEKVAPVYGPQAQAPLCFRKAAVYLSKQLHSQKLQCNRSSWCIRW